MKKIAIISGASKSLVNFRGDLIIEIVRRGHSVYAIGPEIEYEREILALGVSEFKHIPMNRTGINIWKDVEYLFHLFKYFREINPDVILGYTIKPVIYGTIAAKLAGVDNINSLITGAGYIFASNSLRAKIISFIGKMLYKVGLNCASHVIFQNKDDFYEFVNLGLVKKQKCYIVNGSGVNMEKYKPRSFPLSISFLMTSRFIYSKGVFEYLKAAEIIKNKYPNIRFITIGKINNKADSISQNELNYYFENKIVEYLGVTNDVPSIIAQSSVYVLPSYREGVPRSTLEAMAMARPILTTDVPGCRETVIDGLNGFLVPPKNVEVLASKMEWFILNCSKIEKMGEESYNICLDKFEVSKVNSQMIQIMKLDKNKP